MNDRRFHSVFLFLRSAHKQSRVQVPETFRSNDQWLSLISLCLLSHDELFLPPVRIDSSYGTRWITAESWTLGGFYRRIHLLRKPVILSSRLSDCNCRVIGQERRDGARDPIRGDVVPAVCALVRRPSSPGSTRSICALVCRCRWSYWSCEQGIEALWLFYHDPSTFTGLTVSTSACTCKAHPGDGKRQTEPSAFTPWTLILSC